MESNAVNFDVDARGVATVGLNRPQKSNAFDDVMVASLLDCFKAIADRQDIRVVVLVSVGKHFSAGADLQWMQGMANYSYAENLTDARKLADMLYALYTLPQPTIARVQGAALGGAVGLVACCDMAVASETAYFCLSEVKLGLLPATISPYVIAAIGARAARAYFLSAASFNCQRALELNLVSYCCADEDLDNQLEQLVCQLLQGGPEAQAKVKQLLLEVSDKPIDDALLTRTSEYIAAARVSPEGQEGLNAFLQKRRAAWASDTVAPPTPSDKKR